MELGLSLTLRQSITLTQRIVIKPPAPIAWSMVDAFKEGDTECRLRKRMLSDFDRMPLADQLKAVDRANAVFRFAYTRGENQDGEERGFFKIPLMRDFNVDLDDIKIRISGKEYMRATAILENAGRLQRIVRSIPYSQLRDDVLGHLRQVGVGPEDAVLVGVDRGGRVPTLVMRLALGHPRAYFLKVDQGGGRINQELLESFIRYRTLQGKYVLFIDSTVDSGRQIDALRRYFDDDSWQERIGHTGWIVIGSNEYGETLDRHLNVNWGVDPDKTFEDDPLLMGVDYAHGTHTRVRAAPSMISLAVRKAIMEVPRGVVLDYQEVSDALRGGGGTEMALSIARKIGSTKAWSKAVQRYQGEDRKPQRIEEFPKRNGVDGRRKVLAVIGTGSRCDLSDAEAEYISLALVPRFYLHMGTPNGNPGKVLESVREHGLRPSDTTLFQPRYMERPDDDQVDENGYITFYSGDTKQEFRRNLIKSAEVVLALGGERGTLTEALMALETGKPLIVVRNFGALGRIVGSSTRFRKYGNLIVVDSVTEAVDKAVELSDGAQ